MDKWNPRELYVQIRVNCEYENTIFEQVIILWLRRVLHTKFAHAIHCSVLSTSGSAIVWLYHVNELPDDAFFSTHFYGLIEIPLHFERLFYSHWLSIIWWMNGRIKVVPKMGKYAIFFIFWTINTNDWMSESWTSFRIFIKTRQICKSKTVYLAFHLTSVPFKMANLFRNVSSFLWYFSHFSQLFRSKWIMSHWWQ